jgi:hypothetical protein
LFYSLQSPVNTNQKEGKIKKKKKKKSNQVWALVAHTCNSSYSGGRDQEDRGSKPARL